MAWFQLDPESVSRRVTASGGKCFVPSLSYSVALGSLGFMAVSIAGFAPWAVTGEFFYRSLGEAGLYAVCAVVFIAVAGPLMHRLVIGPGSLWRFTALFGVSFAAYSAAWIAGWMAFGGHTGSVVGLLAGAVVMGAMLAWAFDAGRAALGVIAVLFLLNATGYFLGGVVEGALLRWEGSPLPEALHFVVAKSTWGVFYGLGFGAGLGWAFYRCQAPTRERLGAVDS